MGSREGERSGNTLWGEMSDATRFFKSPGAARKRGSCKSYWLMWCILFGSVDSAFVPKLEVVGTFIISLSSLSHLFLFEGRFFSSSEGCICLAKSWLAKNRLCCSSSYEQSFFTKKGLPIMGRLPCGDAPLGYVNPESNPRSRVSII